jgi:hypothetical protein
MCPTVQLGENVADLKAQTPVRESPTRSGQMLAKPRCAAGRQRAAPEKIVMRRHEELGAGLEGRTGPTSGVDGAAGDKSKRQYFFTT